MLVTGFPYDVHSRVEEIVGLFAAFVGQARAVRRLGSAAIDLCYVAAGRMDGFWESDLKPWDIAGGALIVAEAGGTVTDLAGGAFSSRSRQVLAIERTAPRRHARCHPRTHAAPACRADGSSDIGERHSPDRQRAFLQHFRRRFR